MPWSGGVYTRGYPSWTNDANNNLPISAAKFDTEDNDFAAGLNNCITKDGLSKPTAAMDWNGQNLTGVNNLTTNASGAISLIGGSLTGNSLGRWVIANPSSGTPLTVGGLSASLSISAAQAVEVATTGIPQFILNSTGVFGYLQNDAANTWSLSYGSTLGTLGTPVIQWDSSNNAKVRDDGGTMQTIGFRDAPQNPQTTNYTLVLGDRGKSVQLQGGSVTTVTIPANASVAYPVGTIIVIVNNQGGSLTIAITSDAMFLAGTATGGAGVSRTLALNGMATLYKFSSTGWFISGSGVS